MSAPISIHLAIVTRDLNSIRDELQLLSDDLSNHAGSLDDADPLYLRNTANAMQTITNKITAQADILKVYTQKLASLRILNP